MLNKIDLNWIEVPSGIFYIHLCLSSVQTQRTCKLNLCYIMLISAIRVDVVSFQQYTMQFFLHDGHELSKYIGKKCLDV